ncbi:phospholipid-binding protein MlaC [Vibrio sp. SNU_ST1]|uniref:MlaC/ttg2D family ABC transporter substrate-binding protein n=1 Tax=Vibrio sp. SNU_ST1 TaxID=3064001 RepID=UPI00272ACED1|nr:phospholipid-binding protein MlaC [Vibrio sp. SNU_ST1]WKY57760.1 phospholipid-binding protein MlaC [Vibrio sp. SNU_ST1]
MLKTNNLLKINYLLKANYLLKIWFLAAVALLMSTPAFSAKPIDRTQPYQMMTQVAEEAFARLKNEQENIHQDPELLKVIVEEELMPYVNAQYAALKLLGPNLKGADRGDVRVFIDAFRKYLVSSYAQVLTQYTDQTIKFGPEPTIKTDSRITSIKVDIIDTPRPNINLEFKLRKDKKSGEWKAFDMVAEGISLLSSKKSEWNTKIRQEGILQVADELEKLASQPIRFESNK